MTKKTGLDAYVPDELHACAWRKNRRQEGGVSYQRAVAEYPDTVCALAEQLDGRPFTWPAHPERPRALWSCWHPVTGEVVGGGCDGIVLAMAAAEDKLAEWGIKVLMLHDPNRNLEDVP